MDNVYIYPNGDQRCLDGPAPSEGERVELDHFVQYEAGEFVVADVKYIS